MAETEQNKVLSEGLIKGRSHANRIHMQTRFIMLRHFLVRHSTSRTLILLRLRRYINHVFTYLLTYLLYVRGSNSTSRPTPAHRRCAWLHADSVILIPEMNLSSLHLQFDCPISLREGVAE